MLKSFCGNWYSCRIWYGKFLMNLQVGLLQLLGTHLLHATFLFIGVVPSSHGHLKPLSNFKLGTQVIMPKSMWGDPCLSQTQQHLSNISRAWRNNDREKETDHSSELARQRYGAKTSNDQDDLRDMRESPCCLLLNSVDGYVVLSRSNGLQWMGFETCVFWWVCALLV